jgi:hypothetical protein
MDENEYRNAYHSINQTRCVFEKSILTRTCNCQHARKFNLAEREGVGCKDEQAQALCSQFLNTVRQQARFALKLADIVGNLLPHNKEIQVQKGALLGLLPDLPNLPDTPIEDIASLLGQAQANHGAQLETLPYGALIQSIVHHPPRERRRRREKNRT